MKPAENPDAILAGRALNVLKHHKKSMDVIALSRLLNADSSTVFRVLCAVPGVTVNKGVGLTTFEAHP